MPCLENTRHEHFCQLVAKGASLRDACRKTCEKPAGYSGTGGSKLMRTAQIRARVSELQEEGARDTAYTLQDAHRPEPVEGLRSIIEATPAGMDENSPVCQYFKRTKDGIVCRFPDKLRALEDAMHLQGFFRETPAEKPVAGTDAASSRVHLPLSLLYAIQEKRRAALAATQYDGPNNSLASPSNPAP